MELFLASTILGVMGVTVLSALVGAAYTIFWVWMVIDSIVRDSRDYPKGVDKLLWVLLNAFLQPAFVLYYFLVYRAATSASATVVDRTDSAAA